jgi:hypothetical protein
VYRQALVKLPRPVFIVLYTGAASYPDRTTLKLSDAFEKVAGNDSVNLELTVEVINIGKGRNGGIVSRCEPLRGYVEFVDTVRVNQARLKEEEPGMERGAVVERAIAQAVSYCKRRGILREFFENLSQEEKNMLTTEWNLEDAIRVAREETWEKAWNKAREETWEKAWNKAREETWGKARKEDRDLFSSLMNQAGSMDELKKMFEKSFAEGAEQTVPSPGAGKYAGR